MLCNAFEFRSVAKKTCGNHEILPGSYDNGIKFRISRFILSSLDYNMQDVKWLWVCFASHKIRTQQLRYLKRYDSPNIRLVCSIDLIDSSKKIIIV